MKSNGQYRQTEIGEIPEEWEIKIASEYCQKVTDGTHDSPKRTEKGKYLVTSKHITSGRINLENAYTISVEDFQEINRRSSVDKWDILLSMIGTVGEVVLVRNDEINFAIKNIGLFKNKSEIEGKWLNYYLQSPIAKHYMKSHSSGSTQQYLTLDSLRKFPIIVAPDTERKAVLEILCSLDDKIELNRRMNKTLEEMGKALFKRWFVDFEFPNENGEPYKSSGGEMVESELGKIPKGWEVAQLRDFGEIVCGKTPPKSNNDFFDGDIPFIKIPDMHGNTFIVNTEDSLSQVGVNHQKNKTLPEGSICVSCIATVGLVSITSKTSQTNQQINSIIPKSDNTRAFLYYTLKQMEKKLQDFASGGSATLNLNTGSFSAITVNKPNTKTLDEFHQITEQIFHQILLNMKEISKLSNIRDSLLPRLMSGKIRV